MSIQSQIQNINQYDLLSVKNINGWIIFGIICSFYFIQTYISDIFIFTDQLYYRSFSDQLTMKSIRAFINIQNKFWWLGYILVPIILLLKVFYATICVSIGAVISDTKFKFKTILKIVLIADSIFIIAQMIYLINILLHLDIVTLETVSNYYPLTILGYFGTQHVVKWLQYPLQTLSAFQVLYMVAIAWLLAKQWKQNFIESLWVVFPSYVTGLVLWLVLVTFLTLQVS